MRDAVGFMSIEKQHAAGLRDQLVLFGGSLNENAASWKNDAVARRRFFRGTIAPWRGAIKIVNGKERAAEESARAQMINHTITSLQRQDSQIARAGNEHDFESGILINAPG
jgi:hypothetical protein